MALCSRSGHVWVSRIYLPIAHGRLESLLSSFPRFLEAGQQHTFIEKGSLRYLFQSIEDNYLVLITNRSSNVLSDLRVLEVFADYTSTEIHALPPEDHLSEETCYKLLLAYDEIYSELGISTFDQGQLQDILSMKSHEEEVQEAILQVHLHIITTILIQSSLSHI